MNFLIHLVKVCRMEIGNPKSFFFRSQLDEGSLLMAFLLSSELHNITNVANVHFLKIGKKKIQRAEISYEYERILLFKCNAFSIRPSTFRGKEILNA